MKTTIIAYLSSLIPMLVIDFIWLTTMSKRFYSVHIGHLMSGSPKLIPAAIFYLIYALGVAVLIILPAIHNQSGIGKVFLLGALLGLVAYGTYDLTNQATLKNWPTIVALVDLAWGALVTGIVSVISLYFTRLFS
jgi:uncharacterized membrane protein